jgi:mannose-6-phosphate isomerase-like protein (cupin superfamily)
LRIGKPKADIAWRPLVRPFRPAAIRPPDAKENAMLDVRPRCAALCLLVLSPLACGSEARAQDFPPGVRLLTPTDFKWAESPRAPGVQTAILSGDPDKPGPYVLRAKYPPNLVNRPHHHPLDEEITVLSGTLYFGHGETMEPTKALALPPGSFVVEPAKTWHYLFTKADPVELEIRGMGPRANIFAK